MRRTDKELNEKGIIYKILNEAIICHLALSHDNIPYVVPMNYAYEKNFIYLHSANNGKKIEILKQNPKVCIQVETQIEIVEKEIPCNWGMRYNSVILMGSAEFIEHETDKIKALDIIMSKYSPNKIYEYSEKSLVGLSIIRVAVDTITAKKSGY